MVFVREREHRGDDIDACLRMQTAGSCMFDLANNQQVGAIAGRRLSNVATFISTTGCRLRPLEKQIGVDCRPQGHMDRRPDVGGGSAPSGTRTALSFRDRTGC